MLPYLASVTTTLREQYKFLQSTKTRSHRSLRAGKLALERAFRMLTFRSCARQRPPRAFLNHPTSVPRFVSQISNIPSIQQQHDSFQTPESRGGLNTRLPSQQLQAANGTGLVAPSSAPVNAGGQWEAQINLYAPRPSTAPMRPAKTERDLPPERELPFTTRPSTKQAAVPKSGENMLGTTRNAISVLSESITRQNKQDIILASIPDVDVPVKGNEIMSMDTSNFQRAMSAQKIDTQEILTKAQVRLARSSMHLRQVKDIAQTQLAPDDQPATTSQKKRRNLRCLQCRSARTKCERNAENFEGTCQPCQAAERQCSFVADVEFSSEDRQAERTVVQVQNSQEEVHSESHLPRRSLRRRRASLKADFTNDVLPKTPIPEMTKNSGATKQQDSRKHSTQIITPMIKPKRLKTPSISSHKRVPVTLPNTKSSTHSEIQDRLPVYKDKVHNKHLCELSNPPADPRSDVSTATAVTDDLNALVPVTPAQKFFKTTTIEQDKPLSDQAEAKLKSQEASNQRIDTDNTAPPYSPFTPSKPEFTFRADNTCISSFLGLHHSEQSVMLDQFFTNAIQDENFLQLCKVLENRYEPMLFPDKW